MTTTPAPVPAVAAPRPVVRQSGLVRNAATPSSTRAWTGEDRYRMIAEAAYFRAERRGFTPGSELYDWLAAEIEVDDILGEAGPR